jgi:hypothetical protein
VFMIFKIKLGIYQIKIRIVLYKRSLEVLFNNGNLNFQPDNISCSKYAFFNKAKIEENRNIFLCHPCNLFLPKKGLIVYQGCIFLIRYLNSPISNCLPARNSNFLTLLEIRKVRHANACLRLPIIAPGEVYKRDTFDFPAFHSGVVSASLGGHFKGKF